MSDAENNEVDEQAENHDVDDPDDLEDYEDEFDDDNVEEEMDAYESLDLVSLYLYMGCIHKLFVISIPHCEVT